MIAVKVLGVLALVAIAAATEEERIVGGRPIQPGEFPHHVSLRNLNRHHVCAGTLVSNRWILTTARCVYKRELKRVIAWVGAHSIQDGTPYQIKKFVDHPNYNPKNWNHNLGLVQTVKPVALVAGRVQVLNLPTHPFNNRESTRLWTVGFGRVLPRFFSRSISNSYRKKTAVESATITLNACRTQLPQQKAFIYNDNICTMGVQNHGTCHGDAGGALTTPQNEFVAINSWANSCGRGIPDVYLLVYPHVAFIRRVLSGN